MADGDGLKKNLRRSQVVEKMLAKLEGEVDKGKTKVSVGDYVRLIQLLKEMEAEEPRDIRVTWVESGETSGSEP